MSAESSPSPNMPALTGRRQPVDRVHATMLRRIDACSARRTEAALSPVADFSVWKRERDRGDRLRRALIAYLVENFREANP